MNIFEFMELPADHRKHPFQLVKHRDEVPASKIAFPVYAQVKRDGVFAAVVVRPDEVAIFGRTGKRFTNTEKLCEEFRAFPLGIYLGEMQTMAIAHLEALSGVVNPNRTEELDWHQQQIKDHLYIDFFDMLTFQAFREGYTCVKFVDRFNALKRRIQEKLVGYNDILPIVPIYTEEGVRDYAQQHIDKGREGAVFKLNEDYEAGHKGYRQTKIVRGVSYDLLCIGTEEGSGKYANKVANLIFQWKGGKTVKAMLGRGWSHEDAADFFLHPEKAVGHIFAVKALQESSKGVLRLPKAGELRHDKESPDV